MSMRKVLLFAAVSVLSMLPFAEAVSYGYVDCDDYSYVFGHGEVRGGITPAGIKWAFSSVDEGIDARVTEARVEAHGVMCENIVYGSPYLVFFRNR